MTSTIRFDHLNEELWNQTLQEIQLRPWIKPDLSLCSLAYFPTTELEREKDMARLETLYLDSKCSSKEFRIQKSGIQEFHQKTAVLRFKVIDLKVFIHFLLCLSERIKDVISRLPGCRFSSLLVPDPKELTFQLEFSYFTGEQFVSFSEVLHTSLGIIPI